jgi:hypothetical protein
MRTLLLGIALLATSYSLQAQAQDIQDIKSRLNQYFKATEDQNWEMVVGYLYPPLFDQVSRKDMIQMFDDMSGNGMELSMSGYRIKRISAPYLHESEQYAEVSYMGSMNIQFTSEAYQAPEMIGRVKGNLEAAYGNDAVTYNETENTFTVAVDKMLYAIADEASAQWHFIENDKQNPMIAQLVPAEVRSHFSTR